jgi:hypothetical protein
MNRNGSIPPHIELSIRNITPKNRKVKFAKAIRSVAQYLGVPVSIGSKDASAHTHGTGEPFLFRSHEELIYKWYHIFSSALDETYNFVISYFGLPEMRIISKADPDRVLTHKGKIIYSPETGEPIKLKEWEAFVALLEKFLNRKLKDADKKIILDSKALGKILNRMLKYNKLPDVTTLPLDKIKYRGKTLSWISESIKNMSVVGDALSRSEMATVQVMQLSAAQRITGVSEQVRSDVKQILIDGVLARKSKAQISQAIFDTMVGHNRDFQRITDTEIQNSMNNALLLDEVHSAAPGEKIYFKRVEIIDDNTCPFCREMNGQVVLWSDNPLPSDKINDPQATYAIWEGKHWESKKKNVVTTGVFHPYCRGTWIRYNAGINALVAETQHKAAQWNAALEQAEQEWKGKGITNPNDTTPGYTERINELYEALRRTEGTDPPLAKSLERVEPQGEPASYTEQVFKTLYGERRPMKFEKSLGVPGKGTSFAQRVQAALEVRA